MEKIIIATKKVGLVLLSYRANTLVNQKNGIPSVGCRLAMLVLIFYRLADLGAVCPACTLANPENRGKFVR